MACKRTIITLLLLITIQFSAFENSNRFKIIQQSIKIELELKHNIDIPDDIPKSHLYYMKKWAKIKQIPDRTMFRLVCKESNFKHNAKSRKNAYGYMQVMPHNNIYYSKKLGIDSNNWKSNIIIGTTLLHAYHKFWKHYYTSDEVVWQYTLASYNYGITNVIKYGIPKSGETHEFIKYILQ